MSNIVIRSQFRHLARVIAAQAEAASGTGHSGTTGKIREEIINKFLKPHLPRTLAIRSGVIIDSAGNRSKQQDCIIVDTRLPLIDIGSEQDALIIAESVIATIEIKSFLNSDELTSTLESIALTKKLIRNGEQIYRKGGIQIAVPKAHPILTYIFAYDGLELTTLTEKISEYAHIKNDGGLTPEAICLLEKGIITRSSLMPVVKKRNVTLPPIKDSKLTMQPLKKDALFGFYCRLIDDVMPLQIINFNIDAYYLETELE